MLRKFFASFFIYPDKILQYKLHLTILANYATVLQVQYHGEQRTMTTPWPLHAIRQINTNATHHTMKENYRYKIIRLKTENNK